MKTAANADKWFQSSVVYHVYPRTFCDALGVGTGNVEGIIGKLDYIQRLNVNTLYVQDIDRVLPDLDSTDDDEARLRSTSTLLSLSRALHERGMHLIIDLPTAYTSPAHPWFLQCTKGDGAFADYYIRRQGKGAEGKRPPDGRRVARRSVWTRGDDGYWYMHAGDCPLLDWGSAAVRRSLFDMAARRLSFGVDGFVINVKDMHTAAYADKKTAMDKDAVRTALSAFVEALRGVSPVAVVLDVGAAPLADAQAFTFADGIRSSRHLPQKAFGFVKPNHVRFKRTLGLWQQGSFARFAPSLYLESADLPRSLGWFTGDYGAYRKEAACMIATATFMLRGTPFIYQGQEIGMTNFPFNRVSDVTDERLRSLTKVKLLSAVPFLNRAVLGYLGDIACDNARTAMQWTALLPNAGFTTDGTHRVPVNPNYMQINVQDAFERDDSVFAYYRRLLALRNSAEYANVLQKGTYCEYYRNNKDLMVYTRSYKGVTLIVVCNLRNADVPFVLPDRIAFKDCTLLAAGYDMPAHLGTVTLRPYECVVYRLD